MAKQFYQTKTGETCILRPAAVEDTREIISYINTVAGESDHLTFGSGEFTVTVEQEEKVIQDHLNSRNQLFLIAEIEGNIVGCLNFGAGQRARTAHTGEFGITVLQKYWGQGIGKQMILYLLNWARESGHIRKINLRVRTDNQYAIELYRRCGFREEGFVTREFLINGSFYDCMMMGMAIDPYFYS